ncbi:MAG: hypothetical protein JRN09_06415 [Nitrososphaerota archaeon]|nr:hypothetical protein [Nitrososphaerota archaeon]
MPREIRSKEEFQKLLPSATEIRVVRSGDNAKVKLRTRDRLYTYRTTGADVEVLTKGTKAPVVEF